MIKKARQHRIRLCVKRQNRKIDSTHGIQKRRRFENRISPNRKARKSNEHRNTWQHESKVMNPSLYNHRQRNDENGRVPTTTTHDWVCFVVFFYLPGKAIVKYNESERCAHLIGAVLLSDIVYGLFVLVNVCIYVWNKRQRQAVVVKDFWCAALRLLLSLSLGGSGCGKLLFHEQRYHQDFVVCPFASHPNYGYVSWNN